ncbi:hypothetical protein HOT64_gp022 [Salmonella phage S132]|uniref:DUF7369 domain-containing protein n=2 Tax=Epseptimavirus TaxID=2732017 RepID=A0A2Z5HNT6_9CAUD|nr:hypothetical protein HOT64_gp022 [Salmonella phage S132]YP_009845353.1 hypothetical protein HWC16_gp092 [Salmonella phage Sepoy]AXC41794.1 hypothetical protein [Salmonella phage S132]QCQ65650.1 hypothetical protein Sepoy_185 [Salmonella phage Sepoy]
MEKAALEAQEVNNFIDPNQVKIDVNQDTNFYDVIVAPPTLDKVVLKVDMFGNVEQWDEEGFIKLCSESQDPTLRAMLAVYNLGIIAGSKE